MSDKSKTKNPDQSAPGRLRFFDGAISIDGERGGDVGNLLESLEQEIQFDEDVYRQQLRASQAELLHLQRSLAENGRPVVVVMEGPDAAGKGGAIKRLVEKLDPRTLRVYSIIKPTAEEFSRHYLWRFWTKIPRKGHVAIFDRSWYGRVLVERVEGFAKPEEWRRAYREINEFERTLTDDGTILVKLFLQITKDEQLVRFKKRASDPLKHWKISDEDWRNRNKWSEHIVAAEEMFSLTSKPHAPWHVVPANSKWFTRLAVLRIVIRTLTNAGIRA